MVAITHAVPGRAVTQERLQQMGLLAEPDPVKAYTPFRASHSTARTWPDYDKCVQERLPTATKPGPDISKADFFLECSLPSAGIALRQSPPSSWSFSPKAKENGEQYARLTAENATAAAERGRQRAAGHEALAETT